MENWITELMEQFGYWGVFFLILIENLFPPIPSEVILTFGGFMTTQTGLTVVGITVVSTLGSVVGAIILYGIGLLIDAKTIEKIVQRWGRYLRLTVADIHKAEGWFAKYGGWAVFLCRFVPLIRSLISLPAGMAHMNFVLFLLLTTIGTFIWNITLVMIGAAVGSSWEKIVGILDIYSNIVYAILALLAIAFVILLLRRRKE